MALSSATKRFLGSILHNRLLSSSFTYTDSRCDVGGGGLAIFSRSFSAEVSSSSNQMNLIKQLRERTSAPIKDVKAALIQCNWDIGPKSLPKTLRFDFSVPFSFGSPQCRYKCNIFWQRRRRRTWGKEGRCWRRRSRLVRPPKVFLLWRRLRARLLLLSLTAKPILLPEMIYFSTWSVFVWLFLI